MSLAKLASGDGYEYYLRNIATHDANERGEQKLADYYSERGESPGRWLGSGLAALGIDPGDEVTEPQMRALFGRGMHPNADAIIAEVTADQMAQGVSRRVARNYGVRLSQLGRPFNQYAADEYGYRYECARAFAAYNEARGRVEYAPVPDEERERIRTEVANRMFTEEHRRPPRDDRELSGWTARASRPASKAVAGFDLTFSPVKSVSALWALAPREVAEKIEAAHHAAVCDALEYIETHAVYTRVGRNGVRLVDVDGLIATAFDHRDSRAGDPDLHTHVVIANRVRRVHDGQWGTLHGKLLYKNKVAASELYNTRLEHHLEQALGLVFADRGGLDMDKRPIREVVGVSPELLAAWSTRAEAITAELAELSVDFQERHGREPTPVELLKLGEKATLVTRGGKHRARSRAEQRTDWRQDAVGVLGGTAAVDEMVSAVLRQQIPQRDAVTAEWVTTMAARAVATVAEHRATWQHNHIRAEAERQLRGTVEPGRWRGVVDQVVTTALSPPCSIPRGSDPDSAEPVPGLVRRDGTSVYITPGETSYTSPEIVAAEQRLVAAAQLTGGHTVPAAMVATAAVEFAANNHGRTLNPGQQAMVTEFATSGARLQVGLAPAGTGKTTAMRVLTDAWRAEDKPVVGLAPTSTAAAQLHRDTGAPTATVDMLVTLADRAATGDLDTAAAPEWFTAIGDGTLVILDEAAKTGTLKLDAAVRFLLDRGAVVRAIGDHRQLAAVAAGGVIRDIIHASGAQTLTEVMRFADPAESAASLALRDGDPAGIAHYTDQGRVQVGTLGAVVEQAFTAWQADTAAGLDALLLAPTRDLVTALNDRARRARLAATGGLEGPETLLADGLSASAGDVICTRRNAYGLRISPTDHVRNGYRWQVRRVHADGAITAAHLGSRRVVTLPADYVAAHTQLGYAATIDAAQGLTVDTCHGVLTGREHRAQLYVMLTRGRIGNYAYIGTAGTGDEDAAYTYAAIHPPTAVDLLTDILGRDSDQTSATTVDRDAHDPALQLQDAVDAYLDALGVAAEHRVGADRLAALADTAEQLVPGVTGEPAWPVLRGHLATLAVSGHDPVAVLTAAVTARELGTAADRAAVLDWRIDPTGRHSRRGSAPGLLSWVPTVPETLRADPDYGELLAGLEHQVVLVHAARLTATAHQWTADTAPRWAQPLLDDRDLVGHLAVWRAAQGVADLDRRPTGPIRYPVAERREQQYLDQRVTARLGALDGAPNRWATFARELDPRIVTDPYWPVLADQLDRAHTAGVDIIDATRQAAAARPLPDEQPAAALRWRLADTLDHPDLEAQDAFAAAVQQVAADQWRRLDDAELAAQDQALRFELSTTPRRSALRPFGHETYVEQVQERHDRLDKKVAAIDAVATTRAAVRPAQIEADTAFERWQAEQATPAPVPWWRPRGRESDAIRAAHEQLVADLRQEWEDLRRAATDAETAARHAETDARLLAGPDREWASLQAQAADEAARAAELADAAERDREVAERDAEHRQRHTDYLDRVHVQLDEIATERQRRHDLDPAQRDLEDRARRHLDGPAVAEPQEHPRASAQRQERDRMRDWHISNAIDHGPPGGYGIDM